MDGPYGRGPDALPRVFHTYCLSNPSQGCNYAWLKGWRGRRAAPTTPATAPGALPVYRLGQHFTLAPGHKFYFLDGYQWQLVDHEQ